MRLLQLLRAAVFLEVGIIITFTYDKTIAVGLNGLISFGVGYALVSVLYALTKGKKLNEFDHLGLTAVALAIGLAAANLPSEYQHQWFRHLVALLGLCTAIYEGLRVRKVGVKTVAGKERLISASLGLALALLFVILPMSDRNAVGFFDTYMLLNAVHLAIGAFTETGSKEQKSA